MAKRKTTFLLLASATNLMAMAHPSDGNGKYSLETIKGSQKRNVILILSDDHRYDFFGFTGKIPWLSTPNMDQLAKEGVYMKNAFVTTSLSSPSRASILTGQYSHVHKVVDNVAPAPDNLVFFPSFFRRPVIKPVSWESGTWGGRMICPNPDLNTGKGLKARATILIRP
jgi:hypothetical protein